jgi:hypothetical protein
MHGLAPKAFARDNGSAVIYRRESVKPAAYLKKNQGFRKVLGRQFGARYTHRPDEPGQLIRAIETEVGVSPGVLSLFSKERRSMAAYSFGYRNIKWNKLGDHMQTRHSFLPITMD